MTKKAREAIVYVLIFAVAATGILLLFLFSSKYKADEPVFKPSISQSIGSTFLSASSIKIDWQDASDNELGFKVERAVGNPENFTEIMSTGPNVTTITDDGLSPDATYYYRLYAYNSLGNSDYSMITSPPKLRNKDYLLGFGDFEKSTVVETNTAFIDPTPGNQVANGWAKNFGGSVTEANCLYQIDEGAGALGSNIQSVSINGLQDSRTSSCGIQKTIWYNENIFPVGSKISFGAGKLAFIDSNPLDYPLNYSNIYYQASLWGIDKDWVTIFSTQASISHDQTSLADLTAEIPAGVNRIFVSIKVYVLLNAGMTQPEGHNPGIMIDDAHLYVTKPGNIEPEQAEFPFAKERAMDTGMTFFNPKIHDPYEIARNLDWADTGFDYADNVLMLKKLNPNFKLYQYHNAATIADYRDTSYSDPVKYPISHRFGEVAANHPEWLYDRYDENNNDLVNWGDYEDLRLEYQKYYYDANGVLQPNKFFFDRAYTYIYSIDPSNTDYQNIWRQEVINYIRYFQSDGVFVDTLGATPPYTVTSGNADLFTLPDDIQKFTQAVYPDLRTAGIDIVHNYCSGHYDTYTGNVTLNPLWRESNLNDVGVPGLENMLTNYYNGTIPIDSFVDNTPQGVADTFFQEWAFFSAKTVNDMIVNSYGLDYWLDSLRDMDNVEIINQSMPDNLKKKLLQYSIGTDYVDDSAIKADHSGWAQFAFGSFMLGKNNYTTFGLSRRSSPTDPSGTINVLINDYHSVSKELGYELSDRQILTELYSDSSLQIREFSKGLVVVNGNGTLDRNYTLANSMLDENGNQISGAITLPPHSARVFYKLPVSTATITNNPLSKNGLFRQTPEITISAQGAVGDSPDIYFTIDDGVGQLYTSPLIIMEGSHTLSYYSKIDDTLIEGVKTLEMIVDLTSPESPVLFNLPYGYVADYAMKITHQPEFNQVAIDGKYAFFNNQNNTWESVVSLEVREKKFVDVISEDLAGNQTINQIEIGRRRGGDCYGADPILADGVVGLMDLSCLAASWRTTNYWADFNGDGTVGLMDLSILSANWRK